MKLLLAYATYSSGTKTASKIVAERLKDQKIDVTRKEIRKVATDELEAYDAIVFASPSWLNNGKEGQPHDFFLTFIEKMRGKTYPDKQFAIFGLGDTAYMHFCGAVDNLEAFVGDLNGKLVLQSLRIDGFYFNQQQNTKLLKDWADQLAQKLL